MSPGIIEKLDELLRDDKNFDTRAGLRFMTELVRDAFRVIEKAEEHISTYEQNQEKIEDRLEDVEGDLKGVKKELDDFLLARKDEKKHDEEERTRWRWAIVGPSLALLVSEIFRWLINR